MRVGEGMEEHGRKVAVHHRHAVFRAPSIRRLQLVEETLADKVLFVVLVEPGPPRIAFHITSLIQAF